MTTPDTDLDDLGQADELTPDELSQPLSLDVQVDETGACQRHVTVKISREDVDRYLDEACGEMMPNAAVPGFRPGRAPRKLVENRFHDEIAEKVRGSLLTDTLTQVTEEQDFSAISEPDFDFESIELPKEGPMVFEFDIEVRPEFEIPEWKGLKLDRPIRKWTKKDLDDRLKDILGRQTQLTPTEEAAEVGDYVTLDITFKHQGQVVSRAEEQTVKVCSTLSFHDGKLEGFDKLISGAKAGDERQGTVIASEDAASEQLRGQEVDIELEVLDVKTLTLPELTEELLAELRFESEEALREAVKEELDRQLAYYQQRSIRQQITSLLTASADWELPPELLRRQSGRELERAVLELRSSGFDEAAIRAHSNELRQNSQASTATALKEHFILERIAEEQNLDASDEDFDMEIIQIAAQSGESPRRVRAQLEKRGSIDVLRNQIIERKAIGLITEAAKFNDVKFNPEKDRGEAVEVAISGKAESDIPVAHQGQVEKLREPAERD